MKHIGIGVCVTALLLVLVSPGFVYGRWFLAAALLTVAVSGLRTYISRIRR